MSAEIVILWGLLLLAVACLIYPPLGWGLIIGLILTPFVPTPSEPQ